MMGRVKFILLYTLILFTAGLMFFGFLIIIFSSYHIFIKFLVLFIWIALCLGAVDYMQEKAWIIEDEYRFQSKKS